MNSALNHSLADDRSQAFLNEAVQRRPAALARRGEGAPTTSGFGDGLSRMTLVVLSPALVVVIAAALIAAVGGDLSSALLYRPQYR